LPDNAVKGNADVDVASSCGTRTRFITLLVVALDVVGGGGGMLADSSVTLFVVAVVVVVVFVAFVAVSASAASCASLVAALAAASCAKSSCAENSLRLRDPDVPDYKTITKNQHVRWPRAHKVTHHPNF
jgi:hypothetical protein